MKRIMVLVGGRSREREVSLNSGAAVASALAAAGMDVRIMDTGELGEPALSLADFESRQELFAKTSGEAIDAPPGAEVGGLATAATNPTDIEPGESAPTPGAGESRLLARQLDSAWRPELVFLALHGGSGEDGTLQGVLDWLGLPYTGAGLAASAMALDKMASKRLFRDAGIPVPEAFLHRVPADHLGDPAAVSELATLIEAALGYPAVAKPRREGSSVGLAILSSREDASLKLPRVIQLGEEILLESFVPGREITAAVLGPGDSPRALPLVEILPKSGLYDYEHKYSAGKTRYLCPAELPEDLSRRIQDHALLAWELLGCRHLARVDFRLAEDDTPYCLELNTLPGMTATSLFPMAAAAAGLDFTALVAEIASLALDS